MTKAEVMQCELAKTDEVNCSAVITGAGGAVVG